MRYLAVAIVGSDGDQGDVGRLVRIAIDFTSHPAFFAIVKRPLFGSANPVLR